MIRHLCLDYCLAPSSSAPKWETTMPEIFKDNATKIEKTSTTTGFFAALIHILEWVVPALTSPALTGTSTIATVLPIILNIAAAVIIVAALAELLQIKHRPGILGKCVMSVGLATSFVGGAMHFAALGYQASCLTNGGNIIAIIGAFTSALAISKWNPHD